MNLAMRKMALLEKELIRQEESARMNGFVTSPIDSAFKQRVTELMDRVRVL